MISAELHTKTEGKLIEYLTDDLGNSPVPRLSGQAAPSGSPTPYTTAFFCSLFTLTIPAMV